MEILPVSRNTSIVCTRGKLSSDKEEADKFVSEFRSFVMERGFTRKQISNCDETGLNFRLLPDATLAGSFEKTVSGRKKSKERMTLNLCSNASGTIKLPVHLIGKAQRPGCLQNMDMKLLPVKYTNQRNTWMTTDQLSNGFIMILSPTYARNWSH